MTLDITFKDDKHITIENAIAMRECDYPIYGQRIIVQCTGNREHYINPYDAVTIILSGGADNGNAES